MTIDFGYPCPTGDAIGQAGVLCLVKSLDRRAPDCPVGLGLDWNAERCKRGIYIIEYEIRSSV